MWLSRKRGVSSLHVSSVLFSTKTDTGSTKLTPRLKIVFFQASLSYGVSPLVVFFCTFDFVGVDQGLTLLNPARVAGFCWCQVQVGIWLLRGCL